MEIVRTFDVNINKIFDLLENSILNEIKLYTNQENCEIIEGFQYSKKMQGMIGNSGNILITIEEFKKPYIYKAKFYSKQGFNFITYNLCEIDENSTQITYKEEFISDKLLNNLNYKIVSKIMYKQNIKRAETLLSAMENYLQSCEK